MKLLMWLAFFGLVIAALYAKFSSSKTKSGQPKPSRQFDNAGAELMQQCVHCGVYIPSSEAIGHAGAVYCCDDHRGKPALY
jgi:hypothetical protein